MVFVINQKSVSKENFRIVHMTTALFIKIPSPFQWSSMWIHELIHSKLIVYLKHKTIHNKSKNGEKHSNIHVFYTNNIFIANMLINYD